MKNWQCYAILWALMGIQSALHKAPYTSALQALVAISTATASLAFGILAIVAYHKDQS